MFWNVVLICPGTRPLLTPGSPSSTRPGSLTSTPVAGSSATRYIATSEENGFSGTPANSWWRQIHRAFQFVFQQRRSDPDVAIFDASGHPGGLSVNSSTPDPGFTPRNPICEFEHACRPSAALGLTCIPAGSVTVVSLISASPNPAGSVVDSCATRTPTFNPVGVSGVYHQPIRRDTERRTEIKLFATRQRRQRPPQRNDAFTGRKVIRIIPAINAQLARTLPRTTSVRQKRLHRQRPRSFQFRIGTNRLFFIMRRSVSACSGVLPLTKAFPAKRIMTRVRRHPPNRHLYARYFESLGDIKSSIVIHSLHPCEPTRPQAPGKTPWRGCQVRPELPPAVPQYTGLVK